MSNTKKVFQILVGNKIFCNVCLKDIEDENSYYFKDEIALDVNKNIELSDLLDNILGLKATSIYASGIICQQCLETAIASYKFINMCKQNIKHLSDSVVLLADRMNSIVKEEEDSMNTLFISLEPEIPITFDDKCTAGYNSNGSVKSDADKCDLSASDCFEPLVKVKVKNYMRKRKSKAKKIPLNEIIYDINNMSEIKCKICQNNYSNLNRLKEHYLRIHAPKTFPCTDCSRSYGSAGILAEHKNNSHKPFMCSHCGKTYIGKSTFKVHLQRHKLRLICQNCSKTFIHKRSYDNHIKNICVPKEKRILNEKYVCDYCGKCYNCKPNLRVHIRFEHENGKGHNCPWCNKKFNAISRLSNHIVTHTQEKKFGCDICGGRFVTKPSLLYHTRIHTGEKPYQCKYCDKTFLSASRRSEHVKRHHAEPMIECNLCHSKFRSKSCLKRHEKRHFNPKSRLHVSQISDNKDVKV
ncbi:hypothetical protein evm_003514 [Chilo suppressalis]|nr:hypothetical protein evm_003514 [Chilo suppressalis]